MVVYIDPLNGIAVPEQRVQEKVQELIADYNARKEIQAIGQFELMNEFRILRALGHLEELTFVYNQTPIQVDRNGQLSSWPRGILGDVADSQLLKLLDFEG